MRKASLLLSVVLLLSPACGTPPAGNGNGDTGGGGNVNDGGDAVTDGGGNLNDGGGTVTDGGGTITDGGGTITDGGGTVTDGGGTVTDGGGTVTDGGGTVTDGGGTTTDGGFVTDGGSTADGGSDAGTGLLPDGGMCATCGALANAYHHEFHSHIVPSPTGAGFGFTDCTLDMGGDMTGTGSPGGCQSAGCQEEYDGTLTSFNTTCNGVSQTSNAFSFGLAYVDPDRLEVWEPDQSTGVWTDIGTAVGDGLGTYTLTFDENMGTGGFSLGINTKTYMFTILP